MLHWEQVGLVKVVVRRGKSTAGRPDNLIPSSCPTRLPNPFCSTRRVCFRDGRAHCNRKPVTQSGTLNTYLLMDVWKENSFCALTSRCELKDKCGRQEEGRRTRAMLPTGFRSRCEDGRDIQLGTSIQGKEKSLLTLCSTIKFILTTEKKSLLLV